MECVTYIKITTICCGESQQYNMPNSMGKTQSRKSVAIMDVEHVMKERVILKPTQEFWPINLHKNSIITI